MDPESIVRNLRGEFSAEQRVSDCQIDIGI
jgi:hypothetical protein